MKYVYKNNKTYKFTKKLKVFLTILLAVLITSTGYIISTNTFSKFNNDYQEVFNEETEDGINVVIEAKENAIPKKSKINIKKIENKKEEVIKESIDDIKGDYLKIAKSYTYDISIIDKDGNEIEPSNDVKISFQSNEIQNNNLELKIYHTITDNNVIEKTEDLESKVEGDIITATTNSFSYYTVAFTYNDKTFNLGGDEDVKLEEILNALELSGEVTNVESSNNELFYPELREDGYYIVSVAPFETDEYLYVTIDGIVYELNVTDATKTSTADGATLTVTYTTSTTNTQATITVTKITLKAVTKALDFSGFFDLSWNISWFFNDNDGTVKEGSFAKKIAKGSTATLFSGTATKTINKVAKDDEDFWFHIFLTSVQTTWTPGGPSLDITLSGSLPKYTITYNANGGSGAPSTGYKWYNQAYNVPSTKPTRTGYNFVNWKISETGNTVNAGGTITAGSNNNYTLVAQWSEKTATLTYANGGHGTAPANVTMKYTTATNAASALSATGYNFTGWKRSDTGAVIAAGAQVKAANVEPTAITLTAQWSEKTATLTYNNGGHGTAPANVTMKYSAATNAASAISATGYTFGGWKRSDNNTVIAAGAQVKAANVEPSALTLTAQWTKNTYTIGYTLNGGTKGTNGPTSGTYDTDVVISNPTKTVTVTGNVNNTGATVGNATSKAQTFSGWTSTTLGSNAKTGTAANPTTAWTGTSTKNTYFRNLRESGTVTMVANWTPVAMTLPTVTKTGYTCNWNTQSNGSGTSYNSGASYTPSATSASSVTMYAICTENTATLTYNNGGHGTAPANVTMKYSTATNAASAITATGYNFTGWKRSDTGAVIAAGAQVKAANVNPTAITLTAQWSEKTATLTYNNGGHGTAPANVTMKYTTATNAAAAISASGYAFAGWKRSDNSTVIAAGAQVKAANVEPTALTLTAQWTPYKLTLKYHVNGGTITTDTSQATRWRANSSLVQRSTDSGSTWADISAVINTDTTTADLWNVGTYNAKKTGYSISGTKAYNTKADGTGVNINQDHNASSSPDNAPTVARINGGALTADKTINMYINWIPNTYTIGYTLNGGTKGTSGPTSGTYDQDVQISNPTKTVTVTGNANGTGLTVGAAQSKAQTFSGWTSSTSAGLGSGAKTGTAANPTTSWTGSSTKNTYFKNLRDTSGTVTLTANWTAVAVTLPTLSAKTGYTCKWYTAASGGSEMGASGASWTPSATSAAAVTAYARCTANTYTIGYTLNGGTKGTNGPTSGTYDQDVQISNPTKTVTVTGNANSTGATIGNATSKAQTFSGWTSTTLGSNAKTGTAANPTTAWSGSSTKNTYFRNLRESGTATMVANWTPVAMTLPTVTKTGYTCNWNTQSNGSGTSYNSGASYTPSATSASSVTMYAICTEKTATLTYANGGHGTAPANVTMKYTTATNAASAITATGYNFTGWKRSDTGAVIAAGAQVKAANVEPTAITLTAQWSEKTATLTYNNGGHGTAPANVTMKYSTATNAASAITATGYTFSGWKRSDTGAVIAAGAQVKAANVEPSALTLTAQWTVNTYTIGYTLNGGTKGTNGPTSGTYDQDVQISNPTKTVTVTGNENSSGATIGNATSKAQTFSGWTSTTLGSNAKTGTAANPTTAWTGTSTKNTYFRNLRESGTATMVANWTPVAMTLPTATKTGYTCKWYSASGTSGGTLIGTSGGAYTPSATSAAAMTVYARCTNSKLTITQEVKGELANINKEFDFTLNVKNNGTNISGTYAYTGTRSGNLTFTNGNTNFKLKHNENIQITFPSDYTYTITQVNDGYTVTKTNDSGTLSEDKTSTFTDTLNGTTPTGIFTDLFPYVLLLLSGIAFVIWIKRFKYI